MKFDRKARHVVPVVRDGVYRVTVTPVGSKDRKVVRPSRSLVGVAAAVEYWQRVDRCGDLGAVMCARTVRESFRKGDRFLLDTERACRCAEVVCGIIENIDGSASSDSTNDMLFDLRTALFDLGSEISAVRMSDARIESFDVLDKLAEAVRECYKVEGFTMWIPKAQIAKVRNKLGNKMRGAVTFTLLGLMFGGYDDVWSPLLTQRQRRELFDVRRDFNMGSVDSMLEYASLCLRKITEIKLK